MKADEEKSTRMRGMERCCKQIIKLRIQEEMQTVKIVVLQRTDYKHLFTFVNHVMPVT